MHGVPQTVTIVKQDTIFKILLMRIVREQHLLNK